MCVYLEAVWDPGHEAEAEDDWGEEEEDEVDPHVGRRVRLQRDHAELAAGEGGSEILGDAELQYIATGK